MEYILIYLYVFIFGTIIGSFANVVAYRLPKEMSVVLPRSSCPSCQKTIYWYENIPVLSFIALRGKCSACHAIIPRWYFFTEVFFGLVAVKLFPLRIDLHTLPLFIFYFNIFATLYCLLLIDLRYMILPNQLNIYLGAMFAFYSAFYLPWNFSLLGLLVGALVPFLVTISFYYLRGKVGLGGGDIKLFGVLGIYLGPLGILQNIFSSCFLGSIIGVILILLGKLDKDKPIPFGPFIIVVASFQIFFPNTWQKLFQSISFMGANFPGATR